MADAAPFFCLRVDLEHRPWDDEAGAAMEPIVLGRLLGLGRTAGLRFHAFATPEALRAFPAYALSILGEGHDLDPLGRSDFGGALSNHAPVGCAVRGDETTPPGMAFVSGIDPFPVLPSFILPRFDSPEISFAAWVDRTRTAVRDRAARGRATTLVVPADLWGIQDPKLDALRGIVSLALAAGLPLRTLREVVAGGEAPELEKGERR